MMLDEIEIGRRHHELEVDLLRIPDRDGEFHGRRSLKRPAPIGRPRRALMPQAAVGIAPCVADPFRGIDPHDPSHGNVLRRARLYQVLLVGSPFFKSLSRTLKRSIGNSSTS